MSENDIGLREANTNLYETDGCCSRFFLFVQYAAGVWNILMKGGTRMKRKVNVKSGKRTTRPAAKRQQIMRKEERKQAKHRKVIYVSTALPRCRNRGA